MKKIADNRSCGENIQDEKHFRAQQKTELNRRYASSKLAVGGSVPLKRRNRFPLMRPR